MSHPLDHLRLLLDEQVRIKLRGAREMTGRLHAYDPHCNMVLGDAVETVFSVAPGSTSSTAATKNLEMVYIRGDSVITVTSA